MKDTLNQALALLRTAKDASPREEFVKRTRRLLLARGRDTVREKTVVRGLPDSKVPPAIRKYATDMKRGGVPVQSRKWQQTQAFAPKDLTSKN